MTWVSALLLAILLVLAIRCRRQRRELDRTEAARQLMQQERERVVDFMHHMVVALGEGLTPRELHQRIVHASILCSGALSACIFERTARDTMRAVALEGLFPPHRPLSGPIPEQMSTRAAFIEQVLKGEEFPVGEGIVGRVAKTQRGELLADARLDPRIVRHEDPILAVRSVICVPLVFRDKFFGVLAVTNPIDDEPFSPADFELVRSLAEQAAMALHNAEFLHLQLEKQQLDLDLSLASGIQRMLLPRATTTMAGLDCAARYLPAQKVGGDLYDLIPLGEDRLGVAVADVSGKGISASLMMAICRTNLRQIAPRHQSPAEALRDLNRTMAGDFEEGLYITMLYAVVDLAAGRMTFARAGHELPLLAKRDPASGIYQLRYCESEGMALGMVPDDIFSEVIDERSEPFGPGDICLLYTDGITEAPNEDGKEFSGSRLADAVRELNEKDANGISDGILEHVRHFSGAAAQRDDLTLVALKRN